MFVSFNPSGFCLLLSCLSQIQGPVDHLKKVTITVSLVTKDPPHRPHPHCLVGKDCPEGSGICLVNINPRSNRRHRCRPMSSKRPPLIGGRHFTPIRFLSLQLRQSWNSVCAEERTGHVPAEEAKPKHRPLSECVIKHSGRSVSRSADLPDHQPLFVSSPSAGDSKGIEDMDMNAVRLCFQCDLEWDDGRTDCLSPVVSSPIYDKSEAKHQPGLVSH